MIDCAVEVGEGSERQWVSSVAKYGFTSMRVPARPEYDHRKYDNVVMPDLRVAFGQTIVEPRRKGLYLQEHFRVPMHNGVSLLNVRRVKSLRVP